VAQAARKHGLTVAEIEDWQERFLLAAENGLRVRPKDEKALKDEHIKKLKQKIGELAVNPHTRAHAAARRSVRVAIWRSTSRRPHVTAICWTSRQRFALPHRLELGHRVGRSQQPRVGALVREGARDVLGLAAVPVHGDQLQRFQELARDRWGGGGAPAAISRATEHLSPPRRRDAFVVRRSLVPRDSLAVWEWYFACTHSRGMSAEPLLMACLRVLEARRRVRVPTTRGTSFFVHGENLLDCIQFFGGRWSHYPIRRDVLADARECAQQR